MQHATRWAESGPIGDTDDGNARKISFFIKVPAGSDPANRSAQLLYSQTNVTAIGHMRQRPARRDCQNDAYFALIAAPTGMKTLSPL